jgi:hypothetical protein
MQLPRVTNGSPIAAMNDINVRSAGGRNEGCSIATAIIRPEDKLSLAQLPLSALEVPVLPASKQEGAGLATWQE